jgi:hypothetical protein
VSNSAVTAAPPTAAVTAAMSESFTASVDRGNLDVHAHPLKV